MQVPAARSRPARGAQRPHSENVRALLGRRPSDNAWAQSTQRRDLDERIAHVSFQSGGLMVPAHTPYDCELLSEHVEPAPDGPAPEPPTREPQEPRWRSGSANCSDASYATRLKHGRSWGQPQRWQRRLPRLYAPSTLHNNGGRAGRLYVDRTGSESLTSTARHGFHTARLIGIASRGGGASLGWWSLVTSHCARLRLRGSGASGIGGHGLRLGQPARVRAASRKREVR